MKNIKTIIIVLILFPMLVRAQDFRISRNSGRLELNVGKVTVEGYDGNEIIFSSTNGRSEKDERAEGLRPINGLGLTDNTGLGVHVAQEGDVVRVEQLKKMQSPDLKVRVPRGIIVAFRHESQFGGKARFINLSNEIEVSAQYNSVELENVTGPLTIETTYGHVVADFNSAIKDPVSIVSIYGYVDVTLPQATKANLKMSTSYGDIFVAPEFNLEMTARDGMMAYSDKITGTLNGGGINIDLNCNYGKIYLRKK